MAKELVSLKKEDDTNWLRDVNSQSLQYSISRLDSALHSAFKSKGKNQKGFPKFKSKKNPCASFVVPQHFDIDNRSILIPKLKSRIRFRKSRKIEGDIKYLIIIQDVKQWYVCIACERPDVDKVEIVNYPVGIDLGIKDFAVTSDGEVIKSPNYSRYEKRIVVRQKQMSRKIKGSHNREKARVKLAAAYQRLRFARRDFLHKASSSIAKNYDVVCMENLNVSGMMKNHCLARYISRQGWYTFKQMLKYKMERKGGYMLEMGRFYPSTETCNHCGWVQDMSLKERVYHCQNCGFEIDRDLNAALNIRDEAMKQIRQELPEFKPVENPTPGSQMFGSRRDPLKQEATSSVSRFTCSAKCETYQTAWSASG